MPSRPRVRKVRLNVEVDLPAHQSRILPGRNRPIVILEYDAGLREGARAKVKVDIASRSHVPSRARILIYIELTARFYDRSARQDVGEAGVVKALEFPDRQNAAGVLEKNVRCLVAVEIVCARYMPTRARVWQICLIKSVGRERIDVIAGALPNRQSAVVVLPQNVTCKIGITTTSGEAYDREVIEVSQRHGMPSRTGERKIETLRRGCQPVSVAVLKPDCFIPEVIEQEQIAY